MDTIIMNTKDRAYYGITAILFLAISVLHLLRVVYRWEAVVGGIDIPLWASGVAVLLAGYLSIRGFSAMRRR